MIRPNIFVSSKQCRRERKHTKHSMGWTPNTPSWDPSLKLRMLRAYWVGSANFSRWKIGHEHDNSVDSGNVAGAREPIVHAHFVFRFKKGLGNKSYFLSMPKIQLKPFNSKLSRQTIDAPSTWQFWEAPSSTEKSLVQQKRQTSWILESMC